MAAHLLGDDTPDAALAGLIADVAGYRTELSVRVAHALAAGVRLVHLKERVPGSGAATAVSALGELGIGSVVLDLDRFTAVADPRAAASLAVREALLLGAGLSSVGDLGVATIADAWHLDVADVTVLGTGPDTNVRLTLTPQRRRTG